MKSLSRSSSHLSSIGLGAPPQAVSPDALARLLAQAAPKRVRARLWELNETVHCSVIGTCLTAGELRRAMGRLVQSDISGCTDHDLHAQAVGLSNRPNEAAKLLHKTLDRRHELAIKRYGKLRGESAVLAAWAESCRAGDIPGAYWAVLTHPDVGHAGVRRAFGDVHMLSHLVGSANRADIKRLTALEADNAALRLKVERQQERLQQAVTSRDATIRRLGSLAAMQAGATGGAAGGATGGATVGASDDDTLAGLRHLVADLQGRLAGHAGRRERLERRAVEAVAAARHWEQRARSAEAQAAALQTELAALEAHREGGAAAPWQARLPARQILYVGGRPGCVEQLRSLLASFGGTLLAHDGGRHDHPSLLPGLISQVDHVAFPVDCVSHDAALAVKRICRQSGKAWVPLRSSGLASFLAAFAAHAHQEVAP